MKQLFQCAILHHKYDGNKCIDTEYILFPEFRLAKSERELLFTLTREIPEECIENPDNIQILIRNF